MADDSFQVLESQIDRFNLADLHSEEEWQGFFNDAISLLEHPDIDKKDYAIERLQKAVWAENSQRYRQPEFKPAEAAVRLLPILEAIIRQPEHREQCLLAFTMWSTFNDEQKGVLADWLNSAQADGLLPPEVITTAVIQARLFASDDWNEVSEFLTPFFDHQNDLLRASAAAAFGEMYANEAAHLPPLGQTMQQVKEREIERPGFAGAFVGPLLMDSLVDGEISGSGIKLTDWILEIVARRKSDEPYVPFYNGIDFHAHEVLSANPDAVGKLISLGAESLAAMTATEEGFPIVGMEEHLARLGGSSDDFVCRTCSWHLAYHYRVLNSEGSRRGFVKLVERDDVDVFLVFNPEELKDRPYAATIYPKQGALPDEKAWRWIDRLIPPQVRPPMEANDWPYHTPQISADSALFVWGAYMVKFHGDCSAKEWQRVWVKWPLPSDEW